MLKQWVYPPKYVNLTQYNILGFIFKISNVVESSANKKVIQGSQANITYFACDFLRVIAEGDPAPLDVIQCQSTDQ